METDRKFPIVRIRRADPPAVRMRWLHANTPADCAMAERVRLSALWTAL